jgi:hypothetical protein
MQNQKAEPTKNKKKKCKKGHDHHLPFSSLLSPTTTTRLSKNAPPTPPKTNQPSQSSPV